METKATRWQGATGSGDRHHRFSGDVPPQRITGGGTGNAGGAVINVLAVVAVFVL
ncbi:hypothetical protein ZHAS_00016327 [Anopheles sinensis]|uniref:Uncharacterized protein n=1 Tax=Anopheles sinensis TaxID=74873 RepID=A0A084WDB5_ANOSI|nr:hypothetical protein ZHAS_00016327 [Anopheles sinensis]